MDKQASETMKIHYIHGNLQTEHVWGPSIEKFHTLGTAFSHLPENLYQEPYEGFDHWTEQFCRKVARESGNGKSVLIGYSLGGRLAMHACLARPELWIGVVVVSADTGMHCPEQKKQQLSKDLAWARRIRTGCTDDFIAEWDRQSVFCGLPNASPRNPTSLDPDSTAHLFDIFSKGRQRDLLPELRRLKNPPILSISGALDNKYTQISQQLDQSTETVRHALVPNAGHRVPWENPDSFCEIVIQFIEELQQLQSPCGEG